jgi:clorobiocin biosynthesis protein CloN7
MPTEVLAVPGAHLHYQVRGSGPVLLLIPGGVMDAAMFARVVEPLAHRYTVVTYDPRGISSSTLDGPAADVPVDLQADDAHRLLSALTTEPAYVFGNSSGATTGLALVTRHSEQVRVLVAHEPPLIELLPDSAQLLAAIDATRRIYRTEGAGPAWTKYLALAVPSPGSGGGSGPGGGPPPAPGPAPSAQMLRNVELFLAHMIGPITRYRPDTAALRAASTRIVVGRGTESAGQTAHRAAVALADQLGTAIVDFPGGHGGFAGKPEAFARTLGQVLAEVPAGPA